MKQYRYNLDNIHKNYLASYANILLKGNELSFINTLTDRQVMLSGEKDSLQYLCLALERGVTDEELCTLLTAFHIENLMDILVAEGMIE